MRTVRLLSSFVAVLWLAGCGPDPAPQPEPADDPPVTCDDEEVVRRVFRAALQGRPAPLADLELPPRVSRVRVAERALHDTLLRRRGATPEPVPLLDALDALSRAEGGADADALGPLVAAWRTWTPADVAAETEGSRRMALATSTLDMPLPPGGAGLRELLDGAPELPVGSTSRAGLAFVAAAAEILDEGQRPGAAGTEALRGAVAAFEGLGWPGGLALLIEPLAAHLLRADPDGERATELWSLAEHGFRRSGDLVRAGGMLLDRAVMLQRAGDPVRALNFAARGRKAIDDSGVVGRERFDALSLHATMSQAAGRHDTAVAAAREALASAEAWRIPVRLRLPTSSVLAVSLFHTGEHGEALRVARDAGATYDGAIEGADATLEQLRASLDETAAEAALELDRPAEAVELFTSAERRFAAAGQREGFERSADARALSGLLLARAHFAAGDEAAARRQVRKAIGDRGLSTAVLALAVNTLLDGAAGREGGALEDAETVLGQVEEALGPGGRDAVAELRGRLAAARGDAPSARRAFERALRRITGGAPGVFGPQASRVLVWYADMEQELGELRRARDLLLEATERLGDAAPPTEIDRIRSRLVGVYRRSGAFVDALPRARRRVESGPPGSAAVRADARLDLFLVLLDLALDRPADDPAGYAEQARAVIETMDADAGAICSEALGRLHRLDAGRAHHESSAQGRLGVLSELCGTLATSRPADLVGYALDLREREGVDPEVRRAAARAALRHAVKGKRTEDVLRLIELRRHGRDISLWTLQSALAPGEVFVAVEPCGTFTAVVTATRETAAHRRIPGMGGVDAFWDATRVEPSAERLAAAAGAVAETVLGGLSLPTAGEPPLRLCLSLAPPLGPLPWDLLPVGDGVLLDAAAVTIVDSAAERAAAWDRSPPPSPPPLPDRLDPLRHRHAMVEVVLLGTDEHARLVELYADARATRGLEPPEALRDAKLRFRAEWALPVGSLPRVPAWAGLALRGAP